MRLDCPGSRGFPAARFMPPIDSAENSKIPGLNCRDAFAGTWLIEGLAPPISGLADYVAGMAAALYSPEMMGSPTTSHLVVVCNLPTPPDLNPNESTAGLQKTWAG